MSEPTLVQIFGAGTTQDSATITIQKSALTGLTPTASNTGQSLLAAILLKAQSSLTQANFDTNTDQSIYLAKGFSSFVTRGTDDYRVDQITVNLAKADTGSTLDPDDY